MDHTTHTDDPEELLQRAADVARSLMPQAAAKLKELIEEVAIQEALLARLEQLAALGRDVGGGHMPKAVAQVRNAALYNALEEKNKETLALGHINLTLMNAKEPLKVAELREAIKATMGRDWAESTLYSHLGKGKNDGRYLNENNKWSLTEHGRQAVL